MLKEVNCSKQLGKIYLESASNPGLKKYVNRTKVKKKWELQGRSGALHTTREMFYPYGIEWLVNVKPREPPAQG